MKKLCALLICLFGLLTVPLWAQNSMKDLFHGNTKLTFLGVDFTHAKFVGGSAVFTNPDAIKSQIIPSINGLLVLEPKKYALDTPFKLKGDRYETFIDNITQVNKAVDVEGNITMEAHELNEELIRKSVSKYNLSKGDGIGVVYIIENLDKVKEQVPTWVTFIDLSSKQVLYTERIIGKPAGFGFRNYWAGGIANVSKQIGSKYYKGWSLKFN